MSAVLIRFCLVLLYICGSSEGLEISAEPGDDVTLRCEAKDASSVDILEWRRDNLGNKKVFVVKNGRTFPPPQHKSFKNRVFLNNNQMKDGDLSVVLKNVKIEDSGTYECRVMQRNDPAGSPLKLMSTIRVQVSDLIPAKSGEDVTLPCEDSNFTQVLVFEWIRSDLKEDKYVFLYRSNCVDLDDQHKSFKDRVSLLDNQMKDGDLSVVLKNVKIEDSGRYECRVLQQNDPQREMRLISTIDLQVSHPGNFEKHRKDKGEMMENGDIRSHLGLIVPLALVGLVAAAGLFTYVKHLPSLGNPLCVHPNWP